MILDKYGRAYDLTRTFADREAAGEYFGGGLGILPDPDPILRKMGEEARILADLEADDQVTAITMARKNRVLNRQDYWFKPGALRDESPTAEAGALCDRLVKDMERLTMRDVISGILEAPFYGLAVLEITWEAADDWWHVAGLDIKPYHWFGFDRENRLVFKGEDKAQARPVPEGKFILARHFPTYQNPYGLRLLSRCFWPVCFKKGGLTFYTRFLEKYGIPWAVTYAPSKATREEMNRMVIDLARMVQDASVVLPYGSKLELATANPGTGDQHETYLKRMDAAISKVLMGNTLTSEIGDKGSYAAAETHKGVADDFADSDADLVVTALNELAWIYTRLNAGPEILSPQFCFEEPEDLGQQADLDAKLYALGVRFNQKYFVNKFSLSEDEFTVSDNQPAAGYGYGYGADFASQPANPDAEYQDAIEQAVKKYAPQAAEAGEKFFSQVWKIIDRAESVEDIERGLAGLMGHDTGPDELEDLLADLLVNANLMGRVAEAKKRRDG